MFHKVTVVLLLMFGFQDNFHSQSKQDSIKYWKLKSLYGLNGTQSSFVNWNAGGKNNISLIGSISASAYFAKDKLNWSTDLNLALGGILYFDPEQNNPIQKTDDRIDLSTSYGVKF
ncbi:MAG: DUF3078 domain-containing protein, partial [Crocinitomicaceae bacterium]